MVRVNDYVVNVLHVSFFFIIINNAQRMKRDLIHFVDNAGSDQPAHPRRLIWAFVVRIHNQWILFTSVVNVDE